MQSIHTKPGLPELLSEYGEYVQLWHLFSVVLARDTKPVATGLPGVEWGECRKCLPIRAKASCSEELILRRFSHDPGSGLPKSSWGISKPITCDPGCCPLQCISKSLFICSVDFLVRTASTRSNAKTVSQTEHFHAIGLLVWSLKPVAVRTGMAIVSHRPIQDASSVDSR